MQLDMMGRSKMKEKLTTDLKQNEMLLDVSESPRKKCKKKKDFNLMSSTHL
jgi:hypothetical protein